MEDENNIMISKAGNGDYESVFDYGSNDNHQSALSSYLLSRKKIIDSINPQYIKEE